MQLTHFDCFCVLFSCTCCMDLCVKSFCSSWLYKIQNAVFCVYYLMFGALFMSISQMPHLHAIVFSIDLCNCKKQKYYNLIICRHCMSTSLPLTCRAVPRDTAVVLNADLKDRNYSVWLLWCIYVVMQQYINTCELYENTLSKSQELFKPLCFIGSTTSALCV